MTLQIAMLPLQQEAELSFTHIRDALSSNWAASATDERIDGEIISFRLDDFDVFVAPMPAPIPWSDLEGPCATSVLWPGAAEVLPLHQAHLVVTASGSNSPIETSEVLTKVTAALCQCVAEALGVFWTNAVMVVPKELFIEFATRVLPEGPPLPIWVDLRVGWNETKTASAGFTTGLAPLGLMELEASAASEQPSDLRQRFESLAYYLLENGPVIRDGDTIGNSEAEKIRVVYSSSNFGADGTVMRLEYAPPERSKPWWKKW
jgi:hypothetical protein